VPYPTVRAADNERRTRLNGSAHVVPGSLPVRACPIQLD
jgi:hypothetical protein